MQGSQTSRTCIREARLGRGGQRAVFTTNQPTFRPMTPQAEDKVYVRQAEQTRFAEAWNSVLARAGKTQQKTWSTQSGKSFCLFGKAAFLLLAAFLVSLAAFCCQNQVLCKTGSRKSAEFGGKSAEFGGKSAESRGSSCQHVGVFVAFRRFFSRAALFVLFGGNFCLLPPEGPGMCVCGCARMQLRRPRAPLLSLSWSKPAATRGLCQLVCRACHEILALQLAKRLRLPRQSMGPHPNVFRARPPPRAEQASRTRRGPRSLRISVLPALARVHIFSRARPLSICLIELAVN